VAPYDFLFSVVERLFLDEDTERRFSSLYQEYRWLEDGMGERLRAFGRHFSPFSEKEVRAKGAYPDKVCRNALVKQVAGCGRKHRPNAVQTLANALPYRLPTIYTY
jgi:hypothetical protein